jgi:tetratricopeptide (TPR) repeat protein
VRDCALFDAERAAAIAPSGSPTIAATGRRRPIVAIANYVFDSLPQDAYRCERGAVEPWLVSLVANAALDADDPALLSRTTVRAERGPACVDPHGDPELDAIWRACVAEAPTGTVLFPVGALGCVRRLLDASGNRLLLLCGDRGGWPSPDATSVDEGPLPSFHGSVSLDVDFRPIAELFRRRGGDVLRGEGGRRDFAVAAFVSGGAASGDADTRAAWARALADDAPGDLLRLRHGVERQLDDLGTEAMLALIRLSHWDPRVLEICLPALAAGAADATEDTKCALAQAIERCWTQWFFLGEPRDFPHEVGLVLAALGAHEQAAARFADSLRLYGEDAATRWNLGVCLARLGRAAEGARCLERAWEVDPDFAPRGAWQKKRAERSPFG